MKRLLSATGAAALLWIGAALSPATAATTLTIDYQNITNNGSPDVGSQLQTEVTGDETNADSTIFFKFMNLIGVQSSITDIYFEDSLGLFDTNTFTIAEESVGVDFSEGADPGDLPGGNPFGFEATLGLTADSNPPAEPNGINSVSEYLVIALDLLSGNTFQEFAAALLGGDFLIGLHVQGLPDEGSDSYVNNPPEVVPIPAGIWLFGTALAGLGLLTRMRRRDTPSKFTLMSA